MMLLLALGAALAQSPTDPYPAQPAPYPLDPGPYPAQPLPYPVQPAPYPVQPAPYPVAPYPAQPAPYPAQPAPYPGQPAPYPGQPEPTPVPVAPPTGALVFVAPLYTADPALQAEAARLSTLLEADLFTRYPTRSVAQVPPWPDYSAAIYMSACPAGQYSGCALVCGNRVGARYSVGGTVSRGFAGGVAVDLVFIDNGASRELLAFGMALDGTNDADLLGGARTILGKITSGAFDAVDLRAVDADPAERAKLDAAQRKLLADSVAELEAQQGQVKRQEVDPGERQKLTKEQIAAMNQRDDVKPWERVEMKEREYLRYRNSGKDLTTWRRLQRGRFGEIIGRMGLGVGYGPFGQQFDGRYAIDDQFQLVELQQYQYITPAPQVQADFELGFGVLPFLDITGHLALQNGPFRYLIHQETVGDPAFLDPVTQRTSSSFQVGARAAFIPLQTKGIRPALHGGFSYWQGQTWQSYVGGVAALQPMEKLTMLLVQAGPGVEITASRRINLFGRALLDIPVGGNLKQSILQGAPFLQERVDVAGLKFVRAGTPGVTVQVGLVGRLALFGDAGGGSGSMIRFEEEEDL